jgi:hypothetical protein
MRLRVARHGSLTVARMAMAAVHWSSGVDRRVRSTAVRRNGLAVEEEGYERRVAVGGGRATG